MKDVNEGFRIGELAARAGVNIQTLRYYERRGLIAEPDRTLGGHRLYSKDEVIRLQVMKAAQSLGFTLDEVSALVDAGSHAHRRRPNLAEQARTKLVQVNEKITALEVIASTLSAVIAVGCDDLVACSQEDSCPVPFAAIAE